MKRRGLSVPHDVDRHPRTALAAQVSGHVGTRQPHGVERVDTHNPVVGQHTDPLGRTADDGIDHDDRIAQNVEFDPDAAEPAVEARIDGLHFVGTDIGRMGIEPFEHAFDSPLDQGPGVHLVDVETVQITVNLKELLQLVRLLLSGRRFTVRQQSGSRKEHGCKQ